MILRLYTVYITINGEKWGEYNIYAPNPQTATFYAGIKYQKEERDLEAGQLVIVEASS